GRLGTARTQNLEQDLQLPAPGRPGILKAGSWRHSRMDVLTLHDAAVIPRRGPGQVASKCLVCAPAHAVAGLFEPGRRVGIVQTGNGAWSPVAEDYRHIAWPHGRLGCDSQQGGKIAADLGSGRLGIARMP